MCLAQVSCSHSCGADGEKISFSPHRTRNTACLSRTCSWVWTVINCASQVDFQCFSMPCTGLHRPLMCCICSCVLIAYVCMVHLCRRMNGYAYTVLCSVVRASACVLCMSVHRCDCISTCVCMPLCVTIFRCPGHSLPEQYQIQTVLGWAVFIPTLFFSCISIY